MDIHDLNADRLSDIRSDSRSDSNGKVLVDIEGVDEDDLIKLLIEDHLYNILEAIPIRDIISHHGEEEIFNYLDEDDAIKHYAIQVVEED